MLKPNVLQDGTEELEGRENTYRSEIVTSLNPHEVLNDDDDISNSNESN